MTELLRKISADELIEARVNPLDEHTIGQAKSIIEEVRRGGAEAVRALALRFGEIKGDEPLVLGRVELEQALSRISPSEAELLRRTAERIKSFAEAQRNSLRELSISVPGGFAGHEVSPVHRAGCYGPGGRYPYPSSILMTVITAKAAGVKEIWAASPKPTDITLAAAAVAGADHILQVGGAHAIAALAYGVEGVSPCDVIVGPGNRWVTAAKQLVSTRVGLDLPAGPSELLVIADSSASAEIIAADLLAQAEHDPDALPAVISLEPKLYDEINQALILQLSDLPSAETAVQALQNGFFIAAKNIEEAASVSNRLAPEHLELIVANPEEFRDLLDHYGALFIGSGSAEVFGDYGAGPNHVLPTGTTARFTGGLSVFAFLRIRTWLKIETPSALASDSAELARLEGLEAHARAAEQRK